MDAFVPIELEKITKPNTELSHINQYNDGRVGLSFSRSLRISDDFQRFRIIIIDLTNFSKISYVIHLPLINPIEKKVIIE